MVIMEMTAERNHQANNIEVVSVVAEEEEVVEGVHEVVDVVAEVDLADEVVVVVAAVALEVDDSNPIKQRSYKQNFGKKSQCFYLLSVLC
jgi:hypothetical protein